MFKLQVHFTAFFIFARYSGDFVKLVGNMTIFTAVKVGGCLFICMCDEKGK